MLEPIPNGAQLVLAHEPGLASESFLYQCAHSRLLDGNEVVYCAFDKPPSAVRQGMSEHGFETADSTRLYLVHAPQEQAKPSEPAAYRLDATNTRQLTRLIESIAGEHPDAVILLQGLNSLID
jgi:KaiC/GvpD/RAD55 family RecA-like ATPase